MAGSLSQGIQPGTLSSVRLLPPTTLPPPHSAAPPITLDVPQKACAGAENPAASDERLEMLLDALPRCFQFHLRSLRDLSRVWQVCKDWREYSSGVCGSEALAHMPLVKLNGNATSEQGIERLSRVGQGLVRLQLMYGVTDRPVRAWHLG